MYFQSYHNYLIAIYLHFFFEFHFEIMAISKLKLFPLLTILSLHFHLLAGDSVLQVDYLSI